MRGGYLFGYKAVTSQHVIGPPTFRRTPTHTVLLTLGNSKGALSLASNTNRIQDMIVVKVAKLNALNGTSTQVWLQTHLLGITNLFVYVCCQHTPHTHTHTHTHTHHTHTHTHHTHTHRTPHTHTTRTHTVHHTQHTPFVACTSS